MLLNRSRGELGGKPFAQHCSCPACFRCSVGSTSGGCGVISLYVTNSCLNHTGLLKAAACASPALNRHGGVVTPPESFSHRTRRCALSLWRRKKIRKQNLRHFFFQSSFAKKMAVAIFSSRSAFLPKESAPFACKHSHFALPSNAH